MPTRCRLRSPRPRLRDCACIAMAEMDGRFARCSVCWLLPCAVDCTSSISVRLSFAIVDLRWPSAFFFNPRAVCCSSISCNRLAHRLMLRPSVLLPGSRKVQCEKSRMASMNLPLSGEEREKHSATFDRLPGADNGKISLKIVKVLWMKTPLHNDTLSLIWKLSDADKDNFLNREEFAVGMKLVTLCVKGELKPPELKRVSKLTILGATNAAAPFSITAPPPRQPSEEVTGGKALRTAADQGNAPKIEALLAGGDVDVNDADQNGYTALMRSAAAGNTEISRLLVKASADLDRASTRDQQTALMFAAKKGHVNDVQLLVDSNAKVDTMDVYGTTALYIASMTGQAAIVKALIAGGANVEAQNKFGLTAAMEAAGSGRVECLEALIGASADLDARDAYGSTALRRAVWFGRKACVQLLLDGGADVNLRDVDSKTPLQHAEKRGHSEIAALLRAAGGTTDDAPPPPTPKTAPVGVEGEGETLYENVRQASVGVEGDGEALYENVQQPSSEKDGEGDALYENVRQVSGDVEGEGEALYENVGTGNVEKKVDPNTAELQAEVARLTAALAEQTEENEALRKKEKLYLEQKEVLELQRKTISEQRRQRQELAERLKALT